MNAIQQLADDLFGIYSTAGREVTYVSDRGERRAYWANRFRQAVQRAVDNDEVVPFVERLVMQDNPSRGFGYLAAAGRLDLSVEALVIDESKVYHPLFSIEAVEASRDRLAAHGYDGKALATDQVSVAAGDLQIGSTFDLRVTVQADGALKLQLL